MLDTRYMQLRLCHDSKGCRYGKVSTHNIIYIPFSHLWGIMITSLMLLADKESEGLVEFFKVRNPTTDLSLNVNSLLTKPIVVSHLCSTCKPCLSYEWSCSLSENFKVPTVPEGHVGSRGKGK